MAQLLCGLLVAGSVAHFWTGPGSFLRATVMLAAHHAIPKDLASSSTCP
jgi:hypothetical protein